MVHILNEDEIHEDHPLFLDEISRKNLVGKTKVQSKKRFIKRLNYRTLSTGRLDLSQLFLKDVLVVKIPVGKYQCTIAFRRILDGLKVALKTTPTVRNNHLNLQVVIKTLSLAFDKSDVLVDCTCPDFKYRFAYWATRYGYKYGHPENRPTKITNPQDHLGSVCKHLVSLLSNKVWIVKVASEVNIFIKAHPDEAAKFLFGDKDYFSDQNDTFFTHGDDQKELPARTRPDSNSDDHDADSEENNNKEKGSDQNNNQMTPEGEEGLKDEHNK